jgi:hypothetical protein
MGYEYSSGDENLLVAISRQLGYHDRESPPVRRNLRAYEDLRRTQEQLLQSEKCQPWAS